MRKWTLQHVFFFLLIAIVSFSSCSDAEYDESGGGTGKPAESLAGTSWKVIEQGVDIIPMDDAPGVEKERYKTMIGAINKYYQDRLKEKEAVQIFEESEYTIKYSINGVVNELDDEHYYYMLKNDSIIQNNGFSSYDEKGVALIYGNILTIRVNISSDKLITILGDLAWGDPNLVDRHIKEIIYQVRGRKISK